MLACGLATLDVVQTVDRLPGADEKVVADGLLVASGGPAANAAVTATALGERARLVTRCGSASLGRIVAEDLVAHGVELADLADERYSPAVSTVLVTRATGQRAVVSVNATSATGTRPDAGQAAGATPGGPAAGPAARLDAALDGVRAVLVDGHHLDLAVPLAAAARARGVPVLLDGGSWKPGLEALLAHVDVAVLSADFVVPAAPALPGRASRPDAPVPPDGGDGLHEVAAFGPVVVARSHGAAPVEVLVQGRRWTIDVPRAEVVDTLGAGDVLHGALLAWLATHPSLTSGSVREGLGLAARAASASCAAPGARGWLSAEQTVAELGGLLTR